MSSKPVCHKCGKDISNMKDYGGFVLERNVELCKEHWDKWITMRNRHHKLEEQFMEKEKCPA